jgi:hypothetical protein
LLTLSEEERAGSIAYAHRDSARGERVDFGVREIDEGANADVLDRPLRADDPLE